MKKIFILSSIIFAVLACQTSKANEVICPDTCLKVSVSVPNTKSGTKTCAFQDAKALLIEIIY